jgi:dephospho-CoA kinase
MLWIGITGPMGSGKSTVGHLLRQKGFEVLDADQIATKVLSPGSAGEAEVLRTFGEQLKGANGSLDRRALGRLVFSDPHKLATLERLIHPRVQGEVANERARLRKLGHAAAFYDVPLLFEKDMQAQFDYVVVVSANPTLRGERLKTRSQLSEAEIAERNSRHLSPAVKEAKASVVIPNEGTLADLENAVDAALRKLKISPTST